MLEVVIAVLLIGGTLLTLVAAATNGVVYQGFSRQRQTGVGVANQVMEQLRALPQETLERGLYDSGLASNAHLVSCSGGTIRLISCTATGDLGSGEAVVRCGGDCATTQPVPLNPSSGSVTLDGVTYTWNAYVTDKDLTTSTDPLRLTVWVDWKWRGRAYDTRAQSLAAFPDGCVGVAPQLVGPPCGTGAGDASGGDAITVTVSWGTPATTYGFSFGGAAVGFQSTEPQTASAEATNPDGTRSSVAVDSDGSTANPDSASSLIGMWASGPPTVASYGYLIGQSQTAGGGFVRARFTNPPLDGAGNPSWPSGRAVAALPPASPSVCGLTAAPCAVGESLARATTPGGGIVVEYVSATGTTAFPLMRIAAGQIPCGSSSVPCFWKDTMTFCYLGAGTNACAAPGGGSIPTFDMLRQVPRVYVGGRSITAATGGGPCLTPSTSPCTRFLGEVFGVCDQLRVSLRTADVQNPGQPTLVSNCGTNMKSTNGGEAAEPGPTLTTNYQSAGYANLTDLNVSYHAAGFSYLVSQATASGGNECSPTAANTWTTSSGNTLTWAAGATTMQWCDRETDTTGANRLLWRLTAGTYRFANGSTSLGWSDGTSLTFTYQVFRCNSTANNTCKTKAEYTGGTLSQELTPPGGITVVISFPRLLAKPSTYDGW
ncbi:MAG: hypothetical protein ACKO8G_05830 [Actinomycetota bacterium]